MQIEIVKNVNASSDSPFSLEGGDSVVRGAQITVQDDAYVVEVHDEAFEKLIGAAHCGSLSSDIAQITFPISY
jgi:hypothetical protein